MRRPGTYFHQTDDDPQRSRGQAAVNESDGFVCAHCGTHHFVPPMTDPASVGGLCWICSSTKDPLKGLICPNCVGGPCIPFEKRLEMVERGELLFSDISRLSR